jgi:hypothetical protein
MSGELQIILVCAPQRMDAEIPAAAQIGVTARGGLQQVCMSRSAIAVRRMSMVVRAATSAMPWAGSRPVIAPSRIGRMSAGSDVPQRGMSAPPHDRQQKRTSVGSG